jgi:lipoprotein-releasing system permease protein
MYKLFLAFRYLTSHRIVYFSIAGVAIGIMVLVIVTSVMNGFSKQLRQRIRGMHAHILIRGKDENCNFAFYEKLVQKIRKLKHVKAASPRIEWGAIPTVKGMMRLQKPLMILGVDPEYEQDTSKLKEYFSRGGKKNFDFNYDTGEKPSKPGVVWGCELGSPYVDIGVVLEGNKVLDVLPRSSGEKAGIKKGDLILQVDAQPIKDETDLYEKVISKKRAGDRVVVKISRAGRTITIPVVLEAGTGSIINLTSARAISGQSFFTKEFEIVGCFRSGMVEYDTNWIIMDLKEAQKFFRLPYAVNTIAVMVDNYEKNHRQVISKVEEVLYEHYGDFAKHIYTIRTWEQEKAVLLQAVAVEKTLQVIILFCIIIVAGFNIIAIYTLMVKAKTRDIGVLMALGATRGGICTIFLISGLICGTIGSIVGISLGLLLAYNLNPLAELLNRIANIEVFPKSIYYLEAIPVAIPYDTLGLIVVATMAVGLIFSIYPAIKAARCNPIEAIRYE